MAELDAFHRMEQELFYAHPVLFGGSEEAERMVVRFGDPEDMGYEEAFPITLLKIEPLLQKYADALGHRDFLGALMNLGIERSTLGDIFIKDNCGFHCGFYSGGTAADQAYGCKVHQGRGGGNTGKERKGEAEPDRFLGAGGCGHCVSVSSVTRTEHGSVSGAESVYQWQGMWE